MGLEVREEAGKGVGGGEAVVFGVIVGEEPAAARGLADREDRDAAGRERDAEEGLAFDRGEGKAATGDFEQTADGGRSRGATRLGMVVPGVAVSGFGVTCRHWGFEWGCLEIVER